jgi:hypothetical protein
MSSFRETHPLKRESPKAVVHYREYKQDLKEDFRSRCGYCNDLDHWTGGWRFYQLDHFVPRKYLVEISENEYSNLIYSCFFCNNAKRAKWPSKDEKISIIGDEGFIHPREEGYCSHFSRDADGSIFAITEIGKYMIQALKLNLKRHAIIWKLEKLEDLFEELEKNFQKIKDKIPHDIMQKIVEINFEYRQYTKELRRENDQP